MDETPPEKDPRPSSKDSSSFKKEALGAALVTTVYLGSLAGGFSYAVANSRKSDPKYFAKGTEAFSLASRALGWGTLYAVGGVGLFSFVVWKALGVHSMKEFGERMRSVSRKVVPEMPRNSTPGRSDFSTFRELFEYLEKGGADKKPADNGSENN